MTEEEREKIQFLNSYRKSWNDIDSINDELLKIETRLIKYGSSIIPPPNGNANFSDDRMLYLVGMKDELQKQLAKEINDCIKLRKKVVKAIESVQDLNDRRLLRLRYINGCTYEEIATEMPYNSKQAVYRRHKEIIKKIKVGYQ